MNDEAIREVPYERVVDVAGKYDPDVWSQRHFAQELLRAVQGERPS